MIAYVQIEAGLWSVASIDDEAGGDVAWWCSRHGWVSPHSSYWALLPSCENERFPSLQKARAFARSQGWEL